MEYGEEQAYYQAMGDAAEAEAQAAMNAEAESKLQDETDCKCGKDSPGWTKVRCCNLCGKSVEPFWKAPDDVAAYRAELKKKIEGMDDAYFMGVTVISKREVLSIIDQTTEI